MNEDMVKGLIKVRGKEEKIPVIVIAEDHAGIRSSLKQWLSTVFQRYDVRDAGTGEDAVELCKKTRPEVVLMDVKLPGINGIEATKQIKKILPDVKIVILTVYDIPAFRAGAIEAGANAFLSKNDMYSKLIPTMKAALECPDDSTIPSLGEADNQENSGKENK